MEPIAYTYEASEHCPTCALARFGECQEHEQVACCVTDNEGNEPGAVAPWDAFEDRDMVCGTCGDVIHALETDESDDLPCPMCGEEKYDDDSFCDGDFCGNDSYRASYGIVHEHSAEALAHRGICEGCVVLANAEATL